MSVNKALLVDLVKFHAHRSPAVQNWAPTHERPCFDECGAGLGAVRRPRIRHSPEHRTGMFPSCAQPACHGSAGRVSRPQCRGVVEEILKKLKVPALKQIDGPENRAKVQAAGPARDPRMGSRSVATGNSCPSIFHHAPGIPRVVSFLPGKLLALNQFIQPFDQGRMLVLDASWSRPRLAGLGKQRPLTNQPFTVLTCLALIAFGVCWFFRVRFKAIRHCHASELSGVHGIIKSW